MGNKKEKKRMNKELIGRNKKERNLHMTNLPKFSLRNAQLT